jgi:hypothetical protein
MQNPTDQAEAKTEASIPMEAVSSSNIDPNWNRTVNVRRKAAKRTFPFDRAAGELLNLVPSSSSSPQAEDIPAAARKKQRIEEPCSVSTDEAITRISPHDTPAVGLPAPAPPSASTAPANSDENEAPTKQMRPHENPVSLPPPPTADNTAANADPSMTDTEPNDGAASLTHRRWTLKELAKLNSAIAKNRKKIHGKDEYMTDWAAVAALIPGRTKVQCSNRWHTMARPDKWSEYETIKLKDAVQTHGGKNWAAIAAMVPSRTQNQCCNKWRQVLNPSIEEASGCTGKWSEDEIIKLKDAVHTHGGKNWAAVAALVPNRTKVQCCSKWRHVLEPPSIEEASGCTGKWTADEEKKLKDAAQTHGGKNWAAIAALIPGRTLLQCRNRWHNILDTNIDPTTARAGKWTAYENKKLEDAMQTHSGKNWEMIAALVPGRTKKQCYRRWQEVLNSTNIVPTTAR